MKIQKLISGGVLITWRGRIFLSKKISGGGRLFGTLRVIFNTFNSRDNISLQMISNYPYTKAIKTFLISNYYSSWKRKVWKSQDKISIRNHYLHRHREFEQFVSLSSQSVTHLKWFYYQSLTWDLKFLSQKNVFLEKFQTFEKIN